MAGFYQRPVRRRRTGGAAKKRVSKLQQHSKIRLQGMETRHSERALTPMTGGAQLDRRASCEQATLPLCARNKHRTG